MALLEYMANSVKKIIKKKNAVVVFLGAPTLFRYCYNKSFLHAKLVLVGDTWYYMDASGAMVSNTKNL